MRPPAASYALKRASTFARPATGPARKAKQLEKHLSIPSVTFTKATKPNQDHQESNRDYVLIDPASGLAVVCDGVGDVVGADQAARLAARTLRTSLRRLLSSAAASLDLTETARQLLEEANRAVQALGKRLAQSNLLSEEECAKTAVVLALLSRLPHGYELVYAHVGDSRAYLLRGAEPLRRLTSDDGYFTWSVGKGTLNEQDARRIEKASHADKLSPEDRVHFDKRNGISQSLGDKDPTLHVGQILLCPSDRILLCTDGIHDNLTDPEIEEVLRTSARTTAARNIVRQAGERSQQEQALRAKKDDISAAVITCAFSIT